jgi:hypothetical protein
MSAPLSPSLDRRSYFVAFFALRDALPTFPLTSPAARSIFPLSLQFLVLSEVSGRLLRAALRLIGLAHSQLLS